MKWTVTTCGFLVGLLVLLAPAVQAQDQSLEASDWEYKVVTVGLPDRESTALLNRLAAEGWHYVGPFGKDQVALRRRLLAEDSATELRRLEGHTGIVNMAAFSPDGDTLASVGEEGSVLLWNWRTGQQRKTLEGHTAGVLHVTWSPDGKTLATSSRDKTVILWDVVKGEKRATLDEHTGAVSASLFSADGKMLATASDDTLVLVRDPTGKVLRKLEGHKQPAIALAYSPDGKTLVSGGGDWGNTAKSGEVIAWDLETGKQRWSAAGDFGGIWSVAFAPDSKTLAGACLDGTVLLWEAGSGKSLAVLQGHTDRVIWLAYTPSGRTLASASYDGTVRLWDTATNKEKAVLKGHTDAVQRLAFSPDGRILATTSNDRTVRIWRLGR
jgi:WD40 repeat protein